MKTSNFQKEQVFNVWYRNFIIFKRTWMISLFWIVLEPLFVLTALGFGLGSYIDRIEGVPYAEFFFPGLLCSSSMMVAFFESTYGNFTKLSYAKVYSTQLLAPMTIEELVLGETLWAATKGTLSAMGIAIIGAFFGLVDGPWIFLALVIVFLNAWMFACIGSIVTSWVQNYDQIIYPTSGFMVPMSLFGGTYFPIEGLNPFLKALTLLMPITHPVQLVRSLALGHHSYWLIAHTAILVLLLIFSTQWALRRMTRRLEG